MMWFKNPDSGQIFEAEGQQAVFAKVHGCVEIEAPHQESKPQTVTQGGDNASTVSSPPQTPQQPQTSPSPAPQAKK